MFQRLQGEAEVQQQQAVEASRKMLTVTWLDPEDSGREPVNEMIECQGKLAQDYNLDLYTASENPDGIRDSVRAALEQWGAFKVVTVCGHGNLAQGGVILKDGVWLGEGCDLSRVGLLLMVSCAIGRLSQERDLDVTGFCVQLAMHQGFAVIAARWSILQGEAVEFANAIVECYLQQTKPQNGNATTLLPRAHALNEARKQLFPATIGWSTLAAFDLYGQG